MTSEEKSEFYYLIECEQKKIFDSSLPLCEKEKLSPLILKIKEMYEELERFYPEDSAIYFKEALEAVSKYSKSGEFKPEDFEIIERIVKDSSYALGVIEELHDILNIVRKNKNLLEEKVRMAKINRERIYKNPFNKVIDVNCTV